MPKPCIIGLAGRAGSGKTTIARAVQHHLRAEGRSCELVSFAAPMRAMLTPLLAMVGADLSRLNRDKEFPIPELGNISARTLLQTLGTEWGRGLDPSFWVNITMQRTSKMAADVVVIDDVRFPNEAAAILARGGQCFRLMRANPIDPLRVSHASEQQEFNVPHLTNTGDAPAPVARALIDLIDQKRAWA